MEDEQKTKEQLIVELKELHRRIEELEATQKDREQQDTIVRTRRIRKPDAMDDRYERSHDAGYQQFRSALSQNPMFRLMLDQTSEELGKTLAEIRVTLEKVNSGEGTAGKLVNDAQLYESLVETSEEMRKMLEEIKSFMAKVNEKGSLPVKAKL